MRILQTLTFNKLAGAEKLCIDLCNSLSKEHEVYLLANSGAKKYLNKDVKFIEFSFKDSRYNPFFLYKIAKLINKINPDIIHSHSVKEVEIIHNARFFLNRIVKIVVTKHMVKFKKRLKFADLCVFLLESDDRNLVKNSTVIENGIPYILPNPVKKSDKFSIISEGRLSKPKGHHIIIKALSKVNFDYELSIFGDGEYKDELQKLIDELNLNDKIKIVGFVDNIQDYLASADLQIIASEFESYCLAAIDGIYYSKLMISTPVGVCANVLPPELLYQNSVENLTEKLNEVYENYDKFREIFSKLKPIKDRFGVEKISEKYIQAYTNLLSPNLASNFKSDKNRMKILHTLHWVQFAGTEKVCVDLCNQMSKNYEVFLLSSQNISPYLEKDVNLVDFDFEHNRYNPLFLYKIAKILSKIKPDIIHCHNTKELEAMHHARIFMKQKIPIIATKHTLRVKKNYKLANLCVAILEDTKEILPPNSLIIKNGMAYKEPKKLPRSDKFYIISSGRLADMKGMDIVINALALVDFDFECHIFGQGEKKDELNALINSLNLSKKVYLKGFVDNINDYLFSSDVQIIASRFEPYGLVAIDGVYYSPLMISTNTGICSQILPRELIFDTSPESLALKLTEIYENYDKFKEIFSKVKSKKDEFSIKNMAQKYIKAYESLLK
ncbi:glycosyltransferase [Campylobacter geochelonis]|uniref:glycosyltransferase n=1 Tax=Campylobacter geochelonis TaxID=1780362 RepID=UPI0007709C86|nr:glycosyltransferase [Campylobacter geochelonis]CZE51357.1 putative lipopolysaccharide biosynthesis protein [Campylobacter geochelonis]